MKHGKAFGDTIEWYNKKCKNLSQNTKSHPRNVPVFISLLIRKKNLDAGSGPGY